MAAAMTIRVWEKGDTVFGRMGLPLRGGGELSVLVSLTHKQVLQAMRRAGIRFSATELARVGSLFGGIGKFVKKVAKSSVVKGMLKVGKSIAGSGLLQALVPGVGIALTAATGAAKLINAAKGGGPKAVKAKLALKAATAQADLENAKGRQLPVPTSVAERGPATAAAYRFLVTVQRVERAS